MEECTMFLSVDDPAQETVLMAVLNDYCRVAGICRESPERLKAAHLVLKAFEEGARSFDELKAALAVNLQTKQHKSRLPR